MTAEPTSTTSSTNTNGGSTKFYAVRLSSCLKGPAIFSRHEDLDAQIALTVGDNGRIEYDEFDTLEEACQYVEGVLKAEGVENSKEKADGEEDKAKAGKKRERVTAEEVPATNQRKKSNAGKTKLPQPQQPIAPRYFGQPYPNPYYYGYPYGYPYPPFAATHAAPATAVTNTAATVNSKPAPVPVPTAVPQAVPVPPATTIAAAAAAATATTTATITNHLLPKPAILSNQESGKGAHAFTAQYFAGTPQPKTTTTTATAAPSQTTTAAGSRKLAYGTKAYEKWEHYFQLLKQYKAKHGSLKISRQRDDYDRKLYEWTLKQQALLWQETEQTSSTVLTPGHVARLSALGLVPQRPNTAYCQWIPEDVREAAFDKTTPTSTATNTTTTTAQDTTATPPTITTTTTPAGSQWEERYQQLLQYKEVHGDTNVLKHKVRNDDAFVRWVNHERKRLREVAAAAKDKISAKDQYIVDKLKEIGLQAERPVMVVSKKEWNPTKAAFWEARYLLLKEYKEKHGTVLVQKTDENWTVQLKRWVGDQAAAVREHERNPDDSPLNQDRYDRLIQLGLDEATVHSNHNNKPKAISVYGKSAPSWDEMFQKLVAFHDIHETTQVPQKPTDTTMEGWSKPLRNWVVKCRDDFAKLKHGQKSDMTPERMGLLQNVGFCFDVVKRKDFDYRAAEWLEYYTKHGEHPPSNIRNTLCLWVCKTKRKYWTIKEGGKASLTSDQIDKLTAWGFDWGEPVVWRGKRK